MELEPIIDPVVEVIGEYARDSGTVADPGWRRARPGSLEIPLQQSHGAGLRKRTPGRRSGFRPTPTATVSRSRTPSPKPSGRTRTLPGRSGSSWPNTRKRPRPPE